VTQSVSSIHEFCDQQGDGKPEHFHPVRADMRVRVPEFLTLMFCWLGHPGRVAERKEESTES
jgi:hypothetical protein